MTDILGHRSVKRRCLAFYNFIWIASILFALAACGGGGGGTGGGNGALKVQLAWQTQSSGDAAGPVPSNLDACTDFNITGIYIRLKDADGKITVKSDILPCTDHNAQLNNIVVQTGYTVEVEGYVGDEARWFGQKGDVSVVAGQGAAPIMIPMYFMDDALAPPTATITPGDSAAKVPTDTTIAVKFDRAMVAETVNAQSILVTNGADPVSGTVTYKADTFEALFKPDPAFAYSTQYSITVTTDVIDPNGQRMAAAITSQFSTPVVWFVDLSNANPGSGKTWEEAFTTIEDAVAGAGNGEQIWVKHGIYKPANQIAIDKPVELLGGFQGTETQHHQRDTAAWKTVVDGNGERRCFYISSDDAVIDGFTLTGGPDHDDSGVMYISNAAPKIIDCLFVDNLTAGRNAAGIEINGGGPSISNCVFINNSLGSSNDGGAGAIYNVGTKATTITDCLFKANVAGEGAAIGIFESVDTTISRCRFIQNVGIGRGGAIDNYNSHTKIQDCIFAGNRVRATPGEEGFAYGGAISNYSRSTLTISNCTIVNNIVEEPSFSPHSYGGGVYNGYESQVNIINSILWGNRDRADSQVFNDPDSSSSINYSDIDQTVSGENNFMEAPRFENDWHLSHDSPCIDKGDSSAATPVDVDGEARPQGAKVDIGADEYIDSDKDHIPDYWEALHGVDLAGNDEDGDQINNLSEFRLGLDPNTAQWVSDATLRGAVRADGYGQASDASTPVGNFGADHYRSFLVFNLSNAPSAKTVAVRLDLVDYNDTAETVTFGVWDVHTAAAVLGADISGQAGIAAYEDLGSGNAYGYFRATPTSKGNVLDIKLNQDAVNAINAAGSGAGRIIIGLSIFNNATSYLSFSDADEVRIHQLILDPAE